MSNYLTNPSLYILQTKLVSPNSQGNSRWTVVNPETCAMYGAVGKDVYPKLLELLKSQNSRDSESPALIENLIEKGLIVKEHEFDKATNSQLFCNFYHAFVHDYRFHNYASINRFNKDREQMAEYGKIHEPPPVYTQRDQSFWTVMLPEPQMELKSIKCELQLLSNILSGTFLAVGEIEGGDFGPWLRKASPSGGARHPTEAWVIAWGKRDIADGIYYFNPQSNCLLFKGPYLSDSRHEQLSLIITSHVERPMWRYRESRSFRAVLLDAGHCIETLNQLCASFGWMLNGCDISQPILDILDLQDITLCAFEISREKTKFTHPKEMATTPISLPHVDTEYKTNPFLWCYFKGSTLVGVISYPENTSVTISDDMFRVLSYAQVSKRGDRPTLPSDITSKLGVSIEMVSALIDSGMLLEQERVRELYTKSAHWVEHGWYQNLLVYLEYRATKIGSSHQKIINPHLLLVPMQSDVLWHALAYNRKTTRSFLDKIVTNIQLNQVLAPCLDMLRNHDTLELLHLKKITNSQFEMEKWSKEQVKFILIKSIAETELDNAVIGQNPIIRSQHVLWLSISVQDYTSEEYFNALMTLGMAMQKLCIQCALLGLGIFITPASDDSKAAAISKLDSLHTINYFAAIGHTAGIKNEE